MTVDVEGGRIRRIGRNPANAATPLGPCLKGLSYVERQHSNDRLLTPLCRTSGGGFEPIAWGRALDLIAEKLLSVRERFGPQSVLYYTGSGTKGLLNGIGERFWRMFGGCTATYGDLCWPAGLEATRLTLGDNKHNAPWDLANAKLILMWGKNASETNIHQMVFVQDALERGARLVVIDPRRTPTAERAELLVQPRPGTDGALALAIARLLIANGWTDEAFIERHVHGYPEFRAMVDEWTPERAAEVTEVPVRFVHRLAELLGTVRPATICAGFGMQRYTNSGQTMRALIALAAITGNIGKPGAGWVYANLQSHIFSRPKDPIAFYPPETPDGVVRVSISTARLGRDMLAQHDPPLKAAWVERGNPLTSNPETPALQKAFRALEFRVVVDEFLTDTAKEADVVLPCKTLFEQSDVITAYWHPYVQWKQKILDPPGDIKLDSEIYYLLAKRIGFPDSEIAKAMPAPGEAAVEEYLAKRLANTPDITIDRLKQGPVLPPGHQEVAFADMVFPTPSGRIELVSEEARRRWNADPLPTYSEPLESPRRDGGPRPPRPLHLMTPNTKNRIHSQFGNLRLIEAVSPKPMLSIHPDDAAARGIRDGDRVAVFNERGRFIMHAVIDFGIKRGCVSVTNGWWRTQGVSVNDLSLGRETDMGHGAAFHDNLVEVVREVDSSQATVDSSQLTVESPDPRS